MGLEVNKEKFKVFLEVAKALNKNFNITPVLFGSLGLYRIIGEFNKANDTDVLIPEEFIHERWNELINFMRNLNFELKDEHEHEFIREGEIVAFGAETDLIKYIQINPETLKTSKVEEAKFRELSPEQYLDLYKFMLRDVYRQEKRGKADQEKIALIQKYLKDKKLGFVSHL